MITQVLQRGEFRVGASSPGEASKVDNEEGFSSGRPVAAASLNSRESRIRAGDAIQWIEVAIMVALVVAWIGTAVFAA